MTIKKVTVAVNDAIAERFSLADSSVTFSMAMNDANEGAAFMISQLSALESKIYEQKYARIFFKELVPVNVDLPEWAQTATYLSYDGATIGKFVGASAKDLATVEMEAKKNTVELGYAGMVVKYSLDELRTSAHMGMPVDQQKMKLAFRGALEHQQKVVFYGDESREMQGLLNHKNVTKSNSSVDWNTASADEILEDVNGFLGDIWSDSAQTFLPNTLLLDTKRFSLIATKRVNAVANDTILTFIKERNISKVNGVDLDIVALPFVLASNMSDNKDRMVAYEKNPENVTCYMPIAPRFLAPQPDGLEIKVPMEYKISGTEFRYPQCAGYRTFDDVIA